MLNNFKAAWKDQVAKLSRREWFQRGSLLSLPALFRQTAAAAPAVTGLRVGDSVYQSIGVRPMVNARGTFTIISGSTMLPEVRAAMAAASQHYVHLDELMDAIGARLAELTKAEWGMVSSGCSAALTHATTACVAGGNPDLHVRIPNLTGFAKDEVVIPKHSRNVYDAAVRAVGVRVIEVGTAEELEAALGPRTAMIYVLAGPNAETGPLAFDVLTRIAKQKSVPVLVDAAAEELTIPNVHLQRGGTLVGYSGGKCLRGPQTAGLLLGRKDLIRAAWVHSAPHHGFARSMKVGKEEAIGMLMAVEMWVKRDHQAEWKQWMSWLNNIQSRVQTVPGVKTSIREPNELSNHTPSLLIRWNRSDFGFNGRDLAKQLMDGEPRITVATGGDNTSGDTGVSITAYMMAPGDDKIIADRLAAVLAQKKPGAPKQETAAPSTDLSGRWDVTVTFANGASTHVLHLKQQGNRLEGTHQGDFVSRDLIGRVSGDTIDCASNYTERHGDSLNYRFTGKLTGANTMAGNLDMGEYLSAKWTAVKHTYRGGEGA